MMRTGARTGYKDVITGVDVHVFLLGSTGLICDGRLRGNLLYCPMDPLFTHLSWHRPPVGGLREVDI